MPGAKTSFCPWPRLTQLNLGMRRIAIMLCGFYLDLA
jgi:hypothetical protein